MQWFFVSLFCFRDYGVVMVTFLGNARKNFLHKPATPYGLLLSWNNTNVSNENANTVMVSLLYCNNQYDT